MFWNVASARVEISLRKWSVQLRTSEGVLVAKMHFVGSNVSFSLMLFYTYIVNQASNTWLADSMWPARVFCAARDAFWEFSNNQHLRHLVYSPVFKNARPASEQVPLKV